MRFRSKALVGFAAVALSAATLFTAAGLPAQAAANRLYCTGGHGTINFKQTAAPAEANGLTQLGYYETTPAKTQTTVTGVTGGNCFSGTSTSGTALGAGAITPLPAIKANPCRVFAAGVAPVSECEMGLAGKFNITAGSKTATVSTAFTAANWALVKKTPNQNPTVTGTGIAANTKYTATSGTGTVGSTVTLSVAATTTHAADALTLNVPTPLCAAASAGICPANETNNYWYGSGSGFASGGTSTIATAIPTITLTVNSHTLVFHTKFVTSVTNSTATEAGFQLQGYTVDTTNGFYTDGVSTCTTATCPSKFVNMIGTDTGTHMTGNTTSSFFQDIVAIISYSSQPPGTAASRAVKILTANFDSAVQTSSTAALAHSYFQS